MRNFSVQAVRLPQLSIQYCILQNIVAGCRCFCGRFPFGYARALKASVPGLFRALQLGPVESCHGIHNSANATALSRRRFHRSFLLSTLQPGPIKLRDCAHEASGTPALSGRLMRRLLLFGALQLGTIET